MIGKLFVLSHNTPDAQRRLNALMEDASRPTIIDIRRKPNDPRRCPGPLREGHLRDQWATRYLWKGASLAEGAYSESASIAEGVPMLLDWLSRGHSLVLLCKCQPGEPCYHREIVAMVVEALPEAEIQDEQRAL